MKYYQLDPVAKELHNKLLVDILNQALQCGWSKEMDTRIPLKQMEDFTPTGKGYQWRESCIFRTKEHLDGLYYDIRQWQYEDPEDTVDETWLGKDYRTLVQLVENLKHDQKDFDQALNRILDQCREYIFRVMGAEFDGDDVFHELPVWLEELEAMRDEFQYGREYNLFIWTRAHIEKSLAQAFASEQLDEGMVTKVTQKIMETDTPSEFYRGVRVVVKLFSTPMK